VANHCEQNIARRYSFGKLLNEVKARLNCVDIHEYVVFTKLSY